jgi:hypothetical protein
VSNVWILSHYRNPALCQVLGALPSVFLLDTTSCKKLVVDMHYETRIQAIVSYHGSVLEEKVTKQDARTMSLTRDQYLQVNTTL